MPNFCMHCGAKLSRPDATFCVACGRPLDGVQGPPGQGGGARTTLVGGVHPTLVVREAGLPPRVVPLTQPQITIGRDPAAGLSIPNDVVSRQHAQLDQRGTEYWLTDLGSTNGTWVNGRRMATSQKLDEGDILRIGDAQGNSISLTFQYDGGGTPASQAISMGRLNLGQLATCIIGRDPQGDIHLDHPTVSRRHAQVKQAAQGHVLRDLGSSNGTFVNGRPVRGSYALQDGDVVQIGPFKLVYDRSGLTQYAAAGNGCDG